MSALNLSDATGPRNFTTSPDDHAGIALTICALMATWAVLCFIVRVYMRLTASGPFGADDILTGVATLFGVLQVATSGAAISEGFGKSTKILGPTQIVRAEKALYASQLLYIVTNALTKCAVSLLLARIVFIKSRVRACYAVLGISALWGVGSFLAQAIRCTEFPPWQLVGGSCSNNVASWEAITAFNVFIEILLFALPIWLVWGLQTNTARKVTVVGIFSLRLPVIIASLVRIHFLAKADDSSQPLLAGVIPFICLNVEMQYGLIAATIPTLKPFVGSFNTGWGTYDTQGMSGYNSNSQSYAMRSLGGAAGTNGTRNKSHGGASQLDRSVDRDENGRLKYVGKNVTQVRGKTAEPSRSNSGASDSSKQMIIRQTMTCEVSYEDENNHASGPTSMDYHARSH